MEITLHEFNEEAEWEERLKEIKEKIRKGETKCKKKNL